MNTAPGTAPSTGPSTTPPPTEVLFDDVRTQTDRELQKLKTELGVDEANTKHKEWEKIKEVFTANKETITKITRAELDQLKADLHDENEELSVELKVEGGALMYDEAAVDGGSTAPETAPTTPDETPVVETPSLAPIISNLPPAAQEQIAQYQPESTGSIGNWLRDMIVNFIAGFAPEWAARIRGFANANVEKRAESAYNALTGDEGANILSDSPLSNILILDHIDKNDLKKILAQYPNLDFSNKRNIEAAFLGKHANDPNLRKYHRIFEGMRDMHSTLSGTDSISYDPQARLKTLLNYSRDENMDAYIVVDTPTTEHHEDTTLPEVVGPAPDSPEAQIELRAQAESLDEALEKAQGMPESTPEEINIKTEAVKNAQEAVTKFKEERKNTILGEYASIQERIKEGERELATLTDINSPEPSEIEKRRVVQENLTKLRAVETAMKAKIEEVITQNGDNWQIKDGVNAEKMVSVETAIRAIENNTASVENQELSEEEKEKQEKMVLDLEKEVNNTLYGGDSDWKKNYQIDNPQDIIALEKEIEDKKRYANNDNLKQKISGMERKIEIAKLKLEAVKAFLKHARWLAEDEGEIPEYETDSDDFIHLEDNGVIDINTIKVSDWSSMAFGDWADERWDLSPYDTKIAESLGGRQEFVNVIKANVEGLKNNEGLFMPKKGGTKFTIIN